MHFVAHIITNIMELTSMNYYNVYTILTMRQFEIFLLIGQGYYNKEIAEKLSRSVGTMKQHKVHICKRLNIKNCKDLTKVAIEIYRNS